MTSTLQNTSSVADDPTRPIESRDGMLVQVMGGLNWMGVLSLLVLLVGMYIAPTTAQAQTVYHVTETGDASNDGSSFGSGDAISLQGALSTAGGSDVIVIAAGRYLPTSNASDRDARFEITGNQDGLRVYGGWTGSTSFGSIAEVENNLAGRDLGQNPTVLSGDIDGDDITTSGITEDASDIQGENSYTVVYLDGTTGGTITTGTVLDGLVITGGQANDIRISSPRSNGAGGGAYCDGNGNDNECSPQFTNIVFAGNTAGRFGGGLYNIGVRGTSSPRVINAIFTGNTAGANGGGMYNTASLGGTSQPQIINTTFTRNSANTNGGAIYGDESTPVITNAILWNNTAGSGDEIYNFGATPTLRHTLIEGGVNGPGVGGNSNNIDGGGNLGVDPGFVEADTPAGEDGAFGTEDDGLRLQSGSPALDSGDNSAVPSSVDTDLLGEARIQNGTVSLGAYERKAPYSGPIYYVNESATAGENDGSSFDDAFTNLQDALNRTTGNDVIVIATGRYLPTDDESDRNARFAITGDQDGLKIYGGWGGAESFTDISDVESKLDSRDLEANPTVLSGDIDNNDNTNANGITEDASDIGGSNSYTVVYLDGTSGGTIMNDTVLDGLVITGGNANGNDSTGSRGGGLYCDGQGANNACSPVLTKLTFTGNSASLEGGAIYSGGPSNGTSSPQITNATFTGNVADRRGGAIYANGSSGESNPRIANSVLTDNSSENGAAIYAQGRNGESSVRVTGTFFINNTASESGGAVFNAGFDDGISSPEITNSVFEGNTAGSNGGAIFNSGVFDGVSSPLITSSVFTGNTAGSDGGAVWSGGDDGISDPQFINVTFTRNDASNDGGALYNLVNGTGTSNPQIVNAILWDNNASRGSEMFNEGAAPTVSHTLIENGVNGSRVEGTDNTDGGDNLDTDPFFVNGGNPAGNDGVFGTIDDGLRLLEGAPAVNAGTNAPFEPGGVAETVTTDLLGDARIQNGTASLGAYESTLGNARLRLTAHPAAATGTMQLANLGTVGVTGADVDLGLPAEVSATTISGEGTVSDGTWTVDVPAEGTATVQIAYERDAFADPGLLDLTATLDTDSYTVEGGGTDATDPANATSDWALLEAPYGSGTALAFDGTNDGATAEAHPDLSGNAPWTIAFWAKVDGSASGADRQGWYLWKGSESQSENRLLGIAVTDQSIEVAHWANDNTYAADVAFDTWQHVAVTYDGNSVQQVYLDGILQDERTDVGTLNVNDGAWSFAQRPDGSDRLPVELDELRMWTEARSQTDIQATMHQTIPANTAGLVASYRFDAAQTSQRFDADHDGITAYDLTGGRNATFEGDPQWTASGAPLGQESVVVAPETEGTIGTDGQALTATVTSTTERFTLYRYGDATADVFDGDALPQGETERTNLVWGAVPGNADASNTGAADLALSYSDVTVPNPSTVGLAERPGPAGPWTARAEEPSSETFTLDGQTAPQEIALYDNAPSILYVDASASGGDTGASWDDAFTDLQDALDIATGNDVTVMAAGTYVPSKRLDAGNSRTATFEITGAQDGLKIYGGWSGSETFSDVSEVEDALDSRNLSANATILSGNLNDDESDDSGNAYHVLVFNGGDAIGPDVNANITTDTVLDGLTITGGNANDSFPNNVGGGLFCDGESTGNACSPALTGLTFTGNSAEFGGAIYNDGSFDGTSSPQITNATFTRNSAGSDGGAIFNNGADGTSNPQVTNASFTGNAASAGGAIFNNGSFGTSSPVVTNTILWGNDANDGNEIYNEDATPTLVHTLIEGGVNGSGIGGGANTDGGNNLDADPLFADADAGDVRLTAGSPAIARGTFAPFETGGIAEDVTTDLAGDARRFGLFPDLGAYELSTIAATSDPITGATGLVGYVEPTGFGGLLLLRDAASGDLTFTRTEETPESPDLPDNVAPVTWTVDASLSAAPTYDLVFDASSLSGIGDFSALMLYKSDDGGQTWNAVDTFSGARLVLDEDRILVAVQDLVGFSQFAIGSSDAGNPLPVELAGFEAQRSGPESVTVQWQTLSETDNAGFEVQRAVGSADGPVNGSVNGSVMETPGSDVSTGGTWETIARLNGAGTTDAPQSYRFEDAHLPYAADSLSYRLRQVDTGGTASLSETVTIARQVTQAELLPTYPNPARHQATVRFAVPERQAVRIDLYDLLGRRVQTVVNADAEGRTEQVLDVSRLASGTYFLRMQTTGHTETQRVTVVR